jgi:hypothetical protein
VGGDCGCAVLQHPHDCPLKEPGGTGRDQSHLETSAPNGLVPGQLVERRRGPVGAGVDTAEFWLCAQSLVLWRDCFAVAGKL